MNEQKPPNAIEWTRIRNADGTMRRGFTWNPVAGCSHECAWLMPDGSVAECYAKTVADKFRSDKVYPHGFNHLYWHPERLKEPLKLKEPAGIFVDSMSDLMDTNVPDEYIHAVLDIARQAPWHVFQLLTKNAPRLRKFDFPANVWVGVSAPPTWYKGHKLDGEQRRRYVFKALDTLNRVDTGVRWMSIEPLSFDMAALLEDWMEERGALLPIEWAVIGAASNGPKLYQPKAEWVDGLHALLDAEEVAIFHKGNLKWDLRREDFPRIEAMVAGQRELFDGGAK